MALERSRITSRHGRVEAKPARDHLRRRRASALGSRRGRRPRLQFRWASAITDEQWRLYQSAMQALSGAGIPFMLGGGFALAAFTGRWRDTKDIDFYIRPYDRDAAVAALQKAGFEDYYSRLPYDRKWIYRSTQSDVIVDIIWSMANQRAQVDDIWFEQAGSAAIRGQKLQVLPPEEFMWCKLYILQRDHCDWVDVFNLLYAMGLRLDWERLLWRLEDDLPLLQGLLSVYGWLCPQAALELPKWLWSRLGLQGPKPLKRPPGRNRIRLLDSRGWFAALQPANRKLEV